MTNQPDTDLKRLLRVLQIGGGSYAIMNGGDDMLVLQSRRGEFRFRQSVLSACIKRGLVKGAGNVFNVTPEGEALLRRGENTGFADQHVDREATSVKLPDGSVQDAVLNVNESPLARLFLRKSRSGEGYLNPSQFGAGERLRADFEKANLRTRMSVDWDREFSSGTRGGAGSDISDLAVDARKRLNEALACLENSLQGVVLDVCCFLKGLEEVERERQWPPRSAKLMLRTALSILAGHYGLEASTHPSNGRIRQWGDGSHRPSMY